MNKQSESDIARRHAEPAANTSHYMTLRVNNLRLMKRFYQQLLGFELLGEFPSAALLKFRVGPGMRIQMLGLLQRSVKFGPERDTVRHIAFCMPVPEHELERKRLEGLGFRVYEMNHKEEKKRSWCFRDPEGNEVELLCCDPTSDN